MCGGGSFWKHQNKFPYIIYTAIDSLSGYIVETDLERHTLVEVMQLKSSIAQQRDDRTIKKKITAISSQVWPFLDKTLRWRLLESTSAKQGAGLLNTGPAFLNCSACKEQTPLPPPVAANRFVSEFPFAQMCVTTQKTDNVRTIHTSKGSLWADY